MTENDLYLFLKDNLYFDLEMSSNEKCSYDSFSRYYKHIVELKCRRTHYDELLLEKYKYDSLMSLGCQIYYANYTPKGFVYIFDLNKVQVEWLSKTMPSTTDFENTNKKEKEVGFLNINQASLSIKVN
jgi:hypothetical protein